MNIAGAPSRRTRAALLASAAAVSLLTTACSGSTVPGRLPAPSKVTLPPGPADFDYQLGGSYTPPAGTSIVVRDHTASPAPGTYGICYVNAFQAQPDAEGEWDDDLLLRDADDEVVVDEDWDEALLDIRTDSKRRRVAAKVNTWIDTCAAKGFQAVEPDNYDSYTRAPAGLLTAADAKAFLTLLADHAHDRGLAIAQKNTPDLAPDREEVGLDFAVVEECGMYDECDTYTAAFGPHVVDIEYDRRGLTKACAGWDGRISIVLRDLDVVPAGDAGHVRETCDSV
jgi:hypothetical protein